MMSALKIGIIVLLILAAIFVIFFVFLGLIIIHKVNRYISDPLICGDRGNDVHSRQWV